MKDDSLRNNPWFRVQCMLRKPTSKGVTDGSDEDIPVAVMLEHSPQKLHCLLVLVIRHDILQEPVQVTEQTIKK